MSREMANPAGLVITSTEAIRSFLSKASNDPQLSNQLQQSAADLIWASNVPYATLRAIWMASDSSTRPDLIRLFSGSHFVFNSPKPREKSEELKARLKKLEDLAERNAYKELVKDITPTKDDNEPFSSYKDQIGFVLSRYFIGFLHDWEFDTIMSFSISVGVFYILGLHVALTMFTGYLVGYAAFRALFNHNSAMNAAGGVLGLVGGMLVETFLFIIRSSNIDSNKISSSKQEVGSSFSNSKLKKNQ